MKMYYGFKLKTSKEGCWYDGQFYSNETSIDSMRTESDKKPNGRKYSTKNWNVTIKWYDTKEERDKAWETL